MSVSRSRSRGSTRRRDSPRRDSRRRRRDSRGRGRGRDDSRGRSRPSKGKGRKDGISVLVRNIGVDANSTDIKHAFEAIGDVRDVYIPKNFHTGDPKDFCFIEFFTSSDARKAIRQMDGEKVCGSVVTVQLAKHGRRSPGAMRTKDSKGYGKQRSDSRR